MRSALPLRQPMSRPPRRETAGRLRWGWGVSDNTYSRRVAVLKRVLPAIGLTLLLLVAIWPRLAPLIERMRLSIPGIDLHEARELRMLNPRYMGTDRENHPFVLTAAVGRQVPDHQDLMSLESPRADMKTHSGKTIVVTAATGIYQSQAQILDLFGNVTVTHQDGTRFVTDAARVNIAAGSAQGHDPVTGQGPSGSIKAQGFRIFHKGETVIFDGRSDAVLKGAHQSAAAAPPPALPPSVAREAAAVEANAQPMLAKAKAAAPAKHPTHRVERHPASHRRVAVRRVEHPRPAAAGGPHKERKN